MDTNIITRWVSILWFLEVIKWGTWPQFTMCRAETDMSCMEPLGLEDRSIADDQITASDYYTSKDRKPAECRLNNNNHWSAASRNPSDPWIQVDFLGMVTISGIRTQGASDYDNEWVTMLRIQTGETDTSLTYIMDGSVPKEFQANNDQFFTVNITFTESIEARYFRIVPTEWNGWINLRFEVLGCQSTSERTPERPTMPTRIQPNGFPRARQEFENTSEMLENVSMDDILSKWENMISFLPEILGIPSPISSQYFDLEIFGDDPVYENSWDVDLTPFYLKISFPEKAWKKYRGYTFAVSVLKLDFKSKLVTSESGYDFQMGSRVISMNMFDSNKSKASYTSEKNFNVTFNLLQDVNGDPSCQFLKLNGKWSPVGCVMSEYDWSHVTCSCNHTTSFAVLMQVTEVEISTANQEALSVLTFIILPISIICLAATIILFIVCKIYKKPRIIIHINLAASLLLAQLLFVTGINAKSKGGCIFMTFILHYFWLVVLMWMLVEGVNIFLKVNPHINWKIKLPICAPLAWGLPAVIASVTLCAGISKYGGKETCWLPFENGLIAAFAAPAFFITVVNFVILVIIIHKFLHLKANQDKSEMERVKADVRSVAILIPLVGLTCIFGMLQFDRAATPFAYLFVFCSGLQGVFIFITQCLLDDDVKVFLKQKVSRGRVDQSNSTADTDTQ